MDRRSRAQQWRRARHNYNDLCPPIGRRAATALLWLSCSIALLRALATSSARAQQRAAQQRRSFLNAHHRSAAQVAPEPEHEHDEAGAGAAAPDECLDYGDEFDYVSDTDSDTESDIESETETETAPTTEPETEPEDERGPPVPPRLPFGQSLTERLHALRLSSPDASPRRRAQPGPRVPARRAEGEGPQPQERDPRDPEESEQRKTRDQQPRRCRPRKEARRDPSPESPGRRGPIPIRRH